jgi:hypothetical protein
MAALTFGQPACAAENRWLTQGIAAYKAGHLQDAYRLLFAASRDPFASADAHYWFGRCLMSYQKPGDAAFEMNMAIKLDPNGSTGQLARESLEKIDNPEAETAQQHVNPGETNQTDMFPAPSNNPIHMSPNSWAARPGFDGYGSRNQNGRLTGPSGLTGTAGKGTSLGSAAAAKRAAGGRGGATPNFSGMQATEGTLTDTTTQRPVPTVSGQGGTRTGSASAAAATEFNKTATALNAIDAQVADEKAKQQRLWNGVANDRNNSAGRSINDLQREQANTLDYMRRARVYVGKGQYAPMYTQTDIDNTSAQYDEMVRRTGTKGETAALEARGRGEEAQLELEKVRTGLDSQLTNVTPNSPTLVPEATNLYVRTYGFGNSSQSRAPSATPQELMAPQDTLVLQRNHHPTAAGQKQQLPLAAGQDVLTLDKNKVGAKEKVMGRLMPVEGSNR